MGAATTTDQRQAQTAALVGLVGAGLLVVTGVLCLATGVHDTYAGDHSDAVVESIWAIALLLAPAAVGAGLPALRRAERTTGAMILCGYAAMAVAVLATVVAGHEVWDVLYIAGFAIAVAGIFGFAITSRRWLTLIVIPAMVLALAFFTSGAAIVLGAAWLFLDRTVLHQS